MKNEHYEQEKISAIDGISDSLYSIGMSITEAVNRISEAIFETGLISNAHHETHGNVIKNFTDALSYVGDGLRDIAAAIKDH